MIKSNEYRSHPPNSLGCVLDRCRCFRHFGAKSRSPGMAGCGIKERVIVPRRRAGAEVLSFRRADSRSPSTGDLSPAVAGQCKYFPFGRREKLGKLDLCFYLQNLIIASLPEQFTSTSLEAIFACGVIGQIAAVGFLLLLLCLHVLCSDANEIVLSAGEKGRQQILKVVKQCWITRNGIICKTRKVGTGG